MSEICFIPQWAKFFKIICVWQDRMMDLFPTQLKTQSCDTGVAFYISGLKNKNKY